MTAGPAFACLPVCTLFMALGLLGVVVVLAGWHRAVPLTMEADPAEGSGRPFPLWLFIAAPAAVLILATLIGLFGPDW
ncbi:MAG: hypothetical protein K2X82_22320 [Gemmataceae bacterium]|nr:hypothetical protein [Gemmataceae bacterium]